MPGLCGSQQGPYQDLLGKLVTANTSKHPCSPHRVPGWGWGGKRGPVEIIWPNPFINR